MDYIKARITIKKGDADILCARLSDIVSGFEIDDPAVIDDFVNDKDSRWDYIEEGLYENPDRRPSVTFYVDDSEDGAMLLARAEALLAAADGEYEMETERVKSADWENNWKEFYKPFKVGSRLYVRPSWESIDDDEGRRVLIMDPASSFGTGSHATTRLCMEQIDAMDCVGKSILDMGCGSGILGCCAMLMGGRSLVACDIEESAITTTKKNLEVNGIPLEKCALYRGDVIRDKKLAAEITEKGSYDIILANIVADVLMAMSEFFKSRLAENGRLILSGIINERAEEVKAHFLSAGYTVDAQMERDGWTMLSVSLR